MVNKSQLKWLQHTLSHLINTVAIKILLQAAITGAKHNQTTRHANIAESVRPTATMSN